MLREAVKNLVAGLLYRTGVLPFLVRRKFADKAVVLTYHRILPQDQFYSSYSHPAIVVEPHVFARHIALLNKYFICLELGAFGERLKKRDFSGASFCLITFDDAWRDNYTYGFDVLKGSHTPAVIFVPTDYIGTDKLFWQERLGHIINQICTRSPETAIHILEKYNWGFIPTLPVERRTIALRSAIRDIKDKDYEEIDRIIADLQSHLGEPATDYAPDSYLSIEHMQEMSKHGISFQSHACSHRILTRLSTEEVERELTASRQWLHEHLGTEPDALAYPNGNHSPTVQQLAAKAGYKLAFTTINGDVEPQSDPFAIRRINLNNNAAGSEARLLLTLLISA